jgi:hypothetical protein
MREEEKSVGPSELESQIAPEEKEGNFPCSKCTCPDFLDGNVNNLLCNRGSCGHGADDHGLF